MVGTVIIARRLGFVGRIEWGLFPNARSIARLDCVPRVCKLLQKRKKVCGCGVGMHYAKRCLFAATEIEKRRTMKAKRKIFVIAIATALAAFATPSFAQDGQGATNADSEQGTRTIGLQKDDRVLSQLLKNP